MIHPLRLALAVAAVVLALAGASAADEAKTPVSATMILSIMSAPVDARRSAYDEALKQPAAPAADTSGEVLADGSVRYGNTTITVKNPCPPGTAHYEPPPLPGRRGR